MEVYNKPRNRQERLIPQCNSKVLCLALLETQKRISFKVNTAGACSQEASHLEESTLPAFAAGRMR